jgi:hypothetical protein
MLRVDSLLSLSQVAAAAAAAPANARTAAGAPSGDASLTTQSELASDVLLQQDSNDLPAEPSELEQEVCEIESLRPALNPICTLAEKCPPDTHTVSVSLSPSLCLSHLSVSLFSLSFSASLLKFNPRLRTSPTLISDFNAASRTSSSRG